MGRCFRNKQGQGEGAAIPLAPSPIGRKDKSMDSRILQALDTTVAAIVPDRLERIGALHWVLDRLGAAEEPKEKLYTTKEAVAEAGCTPKTLRAWERRGIVKCYRVTSRRVRWSLAGLRERLGRGGSVA